MKPTWLRYLNPFYFEIHFFIWMAWCNAIIAGFLFLLTLFIGVEFWPLAFKIAHVTELSTSQLNQIVDPGKLREMLGAEIHDRHLFWKNTADVSGTLMLLGATVL